ncbi:hypothetical protein BDA96_05G208800 [Sorghum bicolor]|uniref:AAA+ ATPase domain-containing protein n=1 Tax=Sorghum bicolor TaxID=4558 RepID=A0A921UH55_SORBI|nr:putative disease resistance RPP13-like protein 3 isoform X2 [Sorghum bicolor]KAG0530695.1 hypothetical protein BDA96_05G208800 [Sorghum bicolor]|eukprot:XP_021317381.1 putative disease resistance RPP13-like protein 3 isoform X2 [Sorghum bicolor]
MAVVTGALPSVLAKLGDLLIGEYKLQKGVKGEIIFLKAELESMKGALEKLSSKPADELDIQDKIWAKDLRELSYDIEDSIDTFMVRGKASQSAKLHGIRKFIDRSVGLFRKAKIRHGIATEIRDIKSRVVEVHERRRRYDVSLGVDKPSTAAVDPRLFSQYTEIEELVGIVETRDELINIVMEENEVPIQKGKIVTIVGFGGLGKTTLAHAVFDKIRPGFDCCASVSVSQTPDLKKLLKGILYQLDKKYEDINEKPLDEGQLVNELRKFLRRKRYFIVIDDIWDISVWRMIKCALPHSDAGYIIITTTRNSDVAEKVGSPYNMKPLSQNNSRKLLYKRIFGNEGKDNNEDIEKCPDAELTEVSERILKKCAGVPLAIITMASLLACKPRNKMDWYEVCNCIGTGLENSIDVENMRKILSFSYYNMPSHLRTCLLYFSVFPEDYKIEKHRLIWMWIAEGFIQCEKHGESLFDLGESYFNELISRSMIQPIHGYNNDTIYECRVHDMVLDLICSLSSEGNFVTILNGTDHIPPSNTIRRLSLQNGKEHLSETLETKRLQQVRSFQVLRVLDLQDCDLSQGYGLKYLGNQFHLRYLGLCGTSIAQLPEEIGSLQFLQILDVRRNKLSCLPSTVVQLKHLMCLYTDLSIRVPNGIGSLTRLEEMSELLIDDSNMDILEELGWLSELRVLRIALGGWNNNLVECLGKLQKLRELSVWARGGQTNIGGLDAWVAPRHLFSLSTRWGCWFSTLPAWINPSLVPDLSKIFIGIRVLQQADLDILGRLPALCYLEMQVEHEDLGIPSGFLVGADSFPCLLSCEFRGFVRPVLFQQGAMPRLRTLWSWFSVRGAREIANSYGGLDLGLMNLPSLQKVSVGLDCNGANDEEVKELRAVLSHGTKIHPNRPRLWINRKAVKDTDNE